MIIRHFKLLQRSLPYRGASFSNKSKPLMGLSVHNPSFSRLRYSLGLSRSILTSNGPDTIVEDDLKAVISVEPGSALELQSSKSLQNVNKSKPSRSRIDRPLANHIDVEAYLEQAKLKQSATNSTVFQGSLYEISVIEYLRKYFSISEIIHQGGKDDKGIDIRANWDLNQFTRIEDYDDIISIGNTKFKPLGSEVVNATKKIMPLALRKNPSKSLNVKLFVQCKCWTKSKIDAKMVREVNGTYKNMVANSSRTMVFFMIFTPTGFTKQGRIDFDSSAIPLIHVNFSKSQLQFPNIKTRGLEYDESAYDKRNYVMGGFQSVYCNPTAQALLKGLNWSEIFSETKLKRKVKSPL